MQVASLFADCPVSLRKMQNAVPRALKWCHGFCRLRFPKCEVDKRYVLSRRVCDLAKAACSSIAENVPSFLSNCSDSYLFNQEDANELVSLSSWDAMDTNYLKWGTRNVIITDLTRSLGANDIHARDFFRSKGLHLWDQERIAWDMHMILRTLSLHAAIRQVF